MSRSVIFRLLVLYSLVLLISFSAIFILFFFHTKRMLYRNAAKELKEDTYEFVDVFNVEGFEHLKLHLISEGRARSTDDVCYTIMEPNGNIIITTDTSQWGGLAEHSDLLSQASDKDPIVIATLRIPQISTDVMVSYIRFAPEKILRMAKALRNTQASLDSYLNVLIVTVILILTVGVIVCWIILHHVIGRVKNVTGTALSISTISLHKRVPLSGFDDEIDDLVRAFNGMLDRIELLVTGLGEVTDNVAHDLKSPVTRIRVVAESLLTTDDANAGVKKIAERIVEESDGLLEMINTTLEIKAIDTGVSPLNFTKCDVAEIVRQAFDLFEIVAEEKGITLQMDKSGPAVINGDLHRLQRVFANLIDNALKYTKTGGKVSVHIQSEQDAVRVKIADTGVGIAPEALGRVFERFYRADQSRNIPGLGLGLSLAETIVKSHGGSITVESSVGAGSTFIVVLPRNG